MSSFFGGSSSSAPAASSGEWKLGQGELVGGGRKERRGWRHKWRGLGSTLRVVRYGRLTTDMQQKKEQIKLQIQQELAVAGAQQLINKITENVSVASLVDMLERLEFWNASCLSEKRLWVTPSRPWRSLLFD